MTEASHPTPPIYVISDGTGDTAQQVLHAAMRQFMDRVVGIRNFPMVKTQEQLRNIFTEAKEANALVVYTLVETSMREHAASLAIEHGVRAIDVLGPILGGLETSFHRSPSEVPGALRSPDEAYFDRIAAIEFTVRADDGRDPRMFRDADIVLTGVSRTGKTPLATFLAHKGYRVGNQPLVLGHEAPKELSDVDPRRVFALTLAPDALQAIRRSRLQAMRMGETSYCDMGYILDELDQADRLFRAHRWAVLDVTDKAIEETAASILAILAQNGLANRQL